MSSAATTLPHRLPGHPVSIPRVLVRNQALLVPAELRFALLLYDRMEREERFVPIADQEWTRYSGLDPRSKELAIKGLKQKGLLLTDGLGERARYCSDTRGFMKWAADADRTKKPRTAGRGVSMKPGAKVHPECAGGCMMLRADNFRETGFAVPPPAGLHVVHGPSSITPTVSTKELPFAKPVSRPGDPGTDQNSRRPRHLKRRLAAAEKAIHPELSEAPSRVGAVNAGASGSVHKPAVDNRPRPAADQSKVSASWPLTLARLERCGPSVGVAFLVRLLDVVLVRFSGVTDQELVEAIERAAIPKATYQKSVGLFLETVPDMLAVMRKAANQSPPANTRGAPKIE